MRLVISSCSIDEFEVVPWGSRLPQSSSQVEMTSQSDVSWFASFGEIPVSIYWLWSRL